MKKLIFTLITISSLNIAYGTSSAFYTYDPALGSIPFTHDQITNDLLTSIVTSTTSTFDPMLGIVLVLDNGENALNTAAPEVQDALDKDELGLELNKLDMAILDKLDELNLWF